MNEVQNTEKVLIIYDLDARKSFVNDNTQHTDQG